MKSHTIFTGTARERSEQAANAWGRDGARLPVTGRTTEPWHPSIDPARGSGRGRRASHRRGIGDSGRDRAGSERPRGRI